MSPCAVGARAWTRHGTALSGHLGGLEDLVAANVAPHTLLDGELVVLAARPDDRPVHDFAAIGRAVTGGAEATRDALRLVAFDLKRINYANALGVDSIDGTKYVRWRGQHLDGGLRDVAVDHHHQLALTTKPWTT
jgi:hypothetical protein